MYVNMKICISKKIFEVFSFMRGDYQEFVRPSFSGFSLIENSREEAVDLRGHALEIEKKYRKKKNGS